MTEPSFCELLEVHAALDETFALHQELLVGLELDAALEVLGAYCELLELHMHHEEEEVLRVFARAGDVPRWPLVLYTGQHEKMRGMLERAAAGLAAVARERPANLRRAVIGLLDFEATYKHLHEHHDGAEREGLFPACDGVTTVEERQQLVERLRSEWQSALTERRPLLERARARLGP
jgi:hypothetical protein